MRKTRKDKGISQGSKWPPDKFNLVADAWSRGESAAAIASQVGVTKNAVIGLAYRWLPMHERAPKFNPHLLIDRARNPGGGIR